MSLVVVFMLIVALDQQPRERANEPMNARVNEDRRVECAFRARSKRLMASPGEQNRRPVAKVECKKAFTWSENVQAFTAQKTLFCSLMKSTAGFCLRIDSAQPIKNAPSIR